MEFYKLLKKASFWSFTILTILSVTTAYSADEQVIFEYQDLAQNKSQIIKEFHDKGYIAVKNVPGFVKAYKKMIKEGRDFVSLSEAEKNKFRPDNYNINGWSFGEEKFNGVQDFYKGSYYSQIPNIDANIWPNTSFKKRYLNLGSIMLNTSREILTLLDFDSKKYKLKSATARMLHYAPINRDTDNPHWCGLHRDHGLFTALAVGVFFKNNKQVNKPNDSGLYIRGNLVRVPSDVLLFQIGETLDLLTNGKVTATEHYVKKASGEYERFAFAVFVDLDKNTIINSTITKYNDRFKPGMTYGEWFKASLKQYYDKT